MTSDRPGGQPGMTWPPATETQANAVAFKAAAVADADPGQDRDFPPAQSRTRRFAPTRRSTSPRAQADRRPAGMTLTTIPSAVLGPVFTAENLGTPQVIQAMMNGSMPAYPRVGFHVASRACPCLAARPRGAW
jgi:hypothetical protein